MSIEYFIKNTVEQIFAGCRQAKTQPPACINIAIKVTPDGSLCRNDEPTGVDLKFCIGIDGGKDA